MIPAKPVSHSCKRNGLEIAIPAIIRTKKVIEGKYTKAEIPVTKPILKIVAFALLLLYKAQRREKIQIIKVFTISGAEKENQSLKREVISK